MRTVPVPANGGKKAASTSTRRHPFVAATEMQVLTTEWSARATLGEMSPAELATAPLALVLLHAACFEEGSPVASLLHALRTRIDGIMQTASANGETHSVEVTLGMLDGWRRMLDSTIELDRRAGAK